MLLMTRSRIIKQGTRKFQLTTKSSSYSFWSNAKKEHNASKNPSEVARSIRDDEGLLNTLDREININSETIVHNGNRGLVQAPNRSGIWSRSQNPRWKAMSGPRFEQTAFELQPAPHSAIELVHKQTVRWTRQNVVSCDGGGGALGHPRVFINTDKPEICVCGYCGRPFANEKHKEYLKSLQTTPYPLDPLENTE